jgi:hypothetical protein
MAPPRHRPYRQAGAAFQIGLRPMPPETWLETGPDHVAFMAAKRERLAGLPPLFFRALPESQGSQHELRDAVVTHLLDQHAEHFVRCGGILEDRIDGSRHDLADAVPLALLGRILEEDFILFQKVDGQDLITAACNAYTSSGRIVSSVGSGMHFAHDPVPGLNDQLGPRIDRVLANVQVGTPVVRFNWFLTPISARLFPEVSHEANVAMARKAAAMLAGDHRRCGDLLWIRSERQTFLRLPQTMALAFGIHTYSDPLACLSDDRESLLALHRLLGDYSETRLAYSAMLELRDPVRRWIEDRLAERDS